MFRGFSNCQNLHITGEKGSFPKTAITVAVSYSAQNGLYPRRSTIQSGMGMLRNKRILYKEE